MVGVLFVLLDLHLVNVLLVWVLLYYLVVVGLVVAYRPLLFKFRIGFYCNDFSSAQDMHRLFITDLCL